MFELSEDHLQIRNLARDFARGEVLPGAVRRDRDHSFPSDLIPQMAEMGFMGMFVPERWGGAGMDILSYVVALEEISYADAGVGVIMSVNNSLVCWPILHYATDAQKEKYLAPLAAGKLLGCYALTEPGAGSDAAAQATRITKSADGSYVLTGTKMWITNGPQADICVAYASLDPSKRHKAICAFILERGFSGYHVGKVEEKLGIACSGTSELIFDQMAVPAENLLGQEGKGFTVAMATLDGGRIGIAAQALGIAQRAFDLAVAYAKQRHTFGEPIANKQAIQWMIADMGTRIEAARLLTYKAAALKGSGGGTGRECSMAKLFASETANFCANHALQIHGGYGYSKEYEVERLYRDARITTLYEGTSEIQRLVIAKSFLGWEVFVGVPIRVLIAKPGLDGHDRGAKVVARGLRDAGMEVIYTGLHRTADQIAEAALQEDVGVVGLSILSGAHNALVPAVVSALRARGLDDVVVMVGGIIPTTDADALRAAGVAAIYPPGAKLSDIVTFLEAHAPRRG